MEDSRQRRTDFAMTEDEVWKLFRFTFSFIALGIIVIYFLLAIKLSFPSNLLPTLVLISVVYFTYRHACAYRSDRRKATLLPLFLIIGAWYLYCVLLFFPLFKLIMTVFFLTAVGFVGYYLYCKYNEDRICLLFVLYSMAVPLIYYLPSSSGGVSMLRYFAFFIVISTPIMNYRNYFRHPYGRSIIEDKFLRGDSLSSDRMDTYITAMQYGHHPILLSCAVFGVFIFESINIHVSYSKVALHSLFCSMMTFLYVEDFLFDLTYIGFISSSLNLNATKNRED